MAAHDGGIFSERFLSREPCTVLHHSLQYEGFYNFSKVCLQFFSFLNVVLHDDGSTHVMKFNGQLQSHKKTRHIETNKQTNVNLVGGEVVIEVVTEWYYLDFAVPTLSGDIELSVGECWEAEAEAHI